MSIKIEKAVELTYARTRYDMLYWELPMEESKEKICDIIRTIFEQLNVLANLPVPLEVEGISAFSFQGISNRINQEELDHDLSFWLALEICSELDIPTYDEDLEQETKQIKACKQTQVYG